MRNVGMRSEYVVTLVAAIGGSSGRRAPHQAVGRRGTLSVITQLDTCRFKPQYALRSLEMSSKASEMRFR
jgi:hypothetical protein